MSSLNSIDIFFLEKIFGMSDGYVLDFSNRTFAEFFATEFNIDIDDDAYCANGQSKAKRLRCFFQKSNDAVTSKVLKALWSYREATRNFNEQAEDVPDAEAKFNEIIHRLEGGSSISKLDAIERFKNDETLEELIS
ncbi:MAG TPA: hypothetical protein VFS04_08475, partial [Alphaproteobacteria bacterium]|nr:hypothetical protein [Alphaproteobacteria bacterium]